MPVAVAEEVDVDEKFSHGLRDRRVGIPKSRITDGRDPYDFGYRQADIYHGAGEQQTSTSGDYRKSGR